MTIELHAWPTPNGFKISILLEELGLPYRLHPVNIGAGDQFRPEFIKISPNNKMPAIVDPDGPDGRPYSVFESGAIMLYLAEKTGMFWPSDTRKRHDMMQWLMFQMAGVGPMMGQALHFRVFAPEQVPYGIERYTTEVRRLYGVMDRRLEQTAYLAGDDYGLADMATYPWARLYERAGIELESFPNLQRWIRLIGDRPAVIRGVEALSKLPR